MSRDPKTILAAIFSPFFLFVFFLLSGPKVLSAAEGAGGTTESHGEEALSFRFGGDTEIVRMAMGYFGFTGESSWKIGFSNSYGSGGSALSFKEQKGGMSLFSLEIAHPQGWVSVNFQGGVGHAWGGQGTDSDYINGLLYFQSRFETSGETAFWAVDLRTAFSSLASRRWVIRPFLGWVHYRDELRLTEGVWTCLYGWPTDRPFSGLDSRYTFTWEALRLGLKGEKDLTAPNPQGFVPWRLAGHVAIFPFVRYRGKGIWNLREDLQQDPSFAHEADQGGLLGVDAALSLVYRPWPWLALEGGGRWFYFSVPSGKDRTFLSNGTVVEVSLEEVKTSRIGAFLTMTWSF